MKKKVILKALAVIVLIAGLALVYCTGRGIVEGNRTFDLFRKIGVKMKDVYAGIDEKGLDGFKDEYRSVFAVVDRIDAMNGSKAQGYLDDVNTAYGLIDTIEATEQVVAAVHDIGTERAQEVLDTVHAAVTEAESAFRAMEAAGSENIVTYMEDVTAVLDGAEDLTAAREELDAKYTDLEEESAEKVKDFFDYVFAMAEEKGAAETVRYMNAAAEAADSFTSAEEFAQQQVTARISAEAPEDAEQVIGYCDEVFRLIDDQGAGEAHEYLQNLLNTMAGQDIRDARSYLDQVYEDTEENRVTRSYLNSIFSMIDTQGADYAKSHGGDICADAGAEDAARANAFLDGLTEAFGAEDGADPAAALREMLSAMDASGVEGAGSNRFLTDLFAVKAAAEKAISDMEKAQKEVDAAQQKADDAKADADAAEQAAAAAVTEEEKAEAEEALAKAQKAYDKALDSLKKKQTILTKRTVTPEIAGQYAAQLREAADTARLYTSPESRSVTQQFQNDVSVMIGRVGLEKARKYTTAACKAYSDKALRTDRLGTDNGERLEAMNETGVFLMRNKARLMIAAVACIIIGAALMFMKPGEDAAERMSRQERKQIGQHMGLKTSRLIANTAIHALLVLISVIWLIPFISIVLQSLRLESTHQVGYILPEKIGFQNYADLFKTDFAKWYSNTFIMALVVAVLQTVIVLCMSYTLSRFRFKLRKGLMRFMLILGMFPGMLTMIILYRVLSDLGMTQKNAVPGLILVYIASSGMGYYVSKGFFDTIPKSLDEAARVDGATRFQVLMKIILPLAKPIVIYTILTAFMGPWGDYVFARYISFGTSAGQNVAVGLYSWLSKDQIASRYTMFCAGGVLVAIPVAVLFMCLQKYYVEGVTGGAVKG